MLPADILIETNAYFQTRFLLESLQSFQSLKLGQFLPNVTFVTNATCKAPRKMILRTQNKLLNYKKTPALITMKQWQKEKSFALLSRIEFRSSFKERVISQDSSRTASYNFHGSLSAEFFLFIEVRWKEENGGKRTKRSPRMGSV